MFIYVPAPLSIETVIHRTEFQINKVYFLPEIRAFSTKDINRTFVVAFLYEVK